MVKIERRSLPQASGQDQRSGENRRPLSEPCLLTDRRPSIRTYLALIFMVCGVLALTYRMLHSYPPLHAVCPSEYTGGRIVSVPAVISHRGALKGFVPGSMAAITKLQHGLEIANSEMPAREALASESFDRKNIHSLKMVLK